MHGGDRPVRHAGAGGETFDVMDQDRPFGHQTRSNRPRSARSRPVRLGIGLLWILGTAATPAMAQTPEAAVSRGVPLRRSATPSPKPAAPANPPASVAASASPTPRPPAPVSPPVASAPAAAQPAQEPASASTAPAPKVATQDPVPTGNGNNDAIRSAVVKIFTSFRAPDPVRPWLKQTPREATGTGMVLDALEGLGRN